MICHEGIFVFESKNYSGWIFGSEEQKNWTQVLPAGRGKSNKIYFYNPVRQNKAHIRELKKHISINVPIWSVIVFSERCTLKKVQIECEEIKVVKRNYLLYTINEVCRKVNEKTLTESDIENIYELLYPYTQTDEALKRKHIENIKKGHNLP